MSSGGLLFARGAEGRMPWVELDRDGAIDEGALEGDAHHTEVRASRFVGSKRP